MSTIVRYGARTTFTLCLLFVISGCGDKKVLWHCNCVDAPPKICSADEPVLLDADTGETLSDCCGSEGRGCGCPNDEEQCECNTTVACSIED